MNAMYVFHFEWMVGIHQGRAMVVADSQRQAEHRLKLEQPHLTDVDLVLVKRIDTHLPLVIYYHQFLQEKYT